MGGFLGEESGAIGHSEGEGVGTGRGEGGGGVFRGVRFIGRKAHRGGTFG